MNFIEKFLDKHGRLFSYGFIYIFCIFLFIGIIQDMESRGIRQIFGVFIGLVVGTFINYIYKKFGKFQ